MQWSTLLIQFCFRLGLNLSLYTSYGLDGSLTAVQKTSLLNGTTNYPWIDSFNDLDYLLFKSFGLDFLFSLRKVLINFTFVRVAESLWDPKLHVFLSKWDELCPAFEEFATIMGHLYNYNGLVLSNPLVNRGDLLKSPLEHRKAWALILHGEWKISNITTYPTFWEGRNPSWDSSTRKRLASTPCAFSFFTTCYWALPHVMLTPSYLILLNKLVSAPALREK